jgi:hypothetical protein
MIAEFGLARCQIYSYIFSVYIARSVFILQVYGDSAADNFTEADAVDAPVSPYVNFMIITNLVLFLVRFSSSPAFALFDFTLPFFSRCHSCAMQFSIPLCSSNGCL